MGEPPVLVVGTTRFVYVYPLPNNGFHNPVIAFVFIGYDTLGTDLYTGEMAFGNGVFTEICI
jgi:hypothetical protein